MSRRKRHAEHLTVELIERLVAMDESIANGNDAAIENVHHRTNDELDESIHEFAGCLRFIDHVRGHSPCSVADLQTECDSQSLWLDGGKDFPPQIGRFKIHRKLGQGGFGIVFLAFDDELQRDIALKVPRIEAIVNDQTRNRFLREARACASLQHPAIASVYEAGRIGPICYIASAYYAGGTLADHLRNTNEPVSPRDAASLVAELADAIEHAHHHRILHRDLKPANILIDTDNRIDGSNSDLTSKVRIVDFGLARTVDSDITRTGITIGTPAYISPEQACGNTESIGPATDIYSLGVILYELLTGETPHQRANDVQTLIAVQCEEPRSPRRIDHRIPTDLDAICMLCLERIPARRYSSAGELAADLHRFLAGEPVLARRVGNLYRCVRWCTRRPTAASLIGLLVMLAIVSPMIAINQTNLYHGAQRTSQRLQQLLYTSDMNVAIRDWEQANFEHFGELLERHVPGPNEPDLRGFEWHYLWRLKRGIDTAPIVHHDLQLESMAVSPDGRVLALGNYSGTITLVDRATKSQLAQWQAHPYRTYSATFSHNGTLLATTSVDNEAIIWRMNESDLSAVRPVFRHRGKRCVAFSPNDRTLAFQKDEHSIGVYDLSTESLRFLEHRDVVCLVFTSDSQLASADRNGQIKRWDLATSELLIEFPAHESAIWSIAQSRDGRFLATGDTAGTTKLWNAHSNQELHSRTGHQSTVLSVVFSDDSQRFASASEDNTIRVWDIASGHSIAELKGHRGDVLDLEFLDDHENLISASDDGDVRVWDIGLQGNAVVWHPKQVTCVEFALDGKRFATSCLDGKVRVYGTERADLMATFDSHVGADSRLQFIRQGKREFLVAACVDGFVRFWDLDSGREVRRIPAQQGTGMPLPIAISNDQTKIAFLGVKVGIEIHDIATGNVLAQLDAPPNVWDFDFSPEGLGFAAASNSEILFWSSYESSPAPQIVSGDLRNAVCLKFSPDGSVLASGAWDRTVKLWDTNSFAQIKPDRPNVYRVLTGSGGAVSSLAFSPCGNTFVTSGGDQTIRFWDLESNQQQAAFHGHRGEVTYLCFSPDGKTIASASLDFTVRLWRSQ